MIKMIRKEGRKSEKELESSVGDRKRTKIGRVGVFWILNLKSKCRGERLDDDVCSDKNVLNVLKFIFNKLFSFFVLFWNFIDFYHWRMFLNCWPRVFV